MSLCSFQSFLSCQCFLRLLVRVNNCSNTISKELNGYLLEPITHLTLRNQISKIFTSYPILLFIIHDSYSYYVLLFVEHVSFNWCFDFTEETNLLWFYRQWCHFYIYRVTPIVSLNIPITLCSIHFKYCGFLFCQFDAYWLILKAMQVIIKHFLVVLLAD